MMSEAAVERELQQIRIYIGQEELRLTKEIEEWMPDKCPPSFARLNNLCIQKEVLLKILEK